MSSQKVRSFGRADYELLVSGPVVGPFLLLVHFVNYLTILSITIRDMNN